MKLPDGQLTNKACPNCGPSTQLVIRTNKVNGLNFLACPNFPTCKHTENVPEDMKMRLSGQPSLFEEVS